MANQEPRTQAEIRADLTTVQSDLARLTLKERTLFNELKKRERHEATNEFRKSKFKRTVGENWKWVGINEEDGMITLTFWEWKDMVSITEIPVKRAEALAEALLETVASTRS